MDGDGLKSDFPFVRQDIHKLTPLPGSSFQTHHPGVLLQYLSTQTLAAVRLVVPRLHPPSSEVTTILEGTSIEMSADMEYLPTQPGRSGSQGPQRGAHKS